MVVVVANDRDVDNREEWNANKDTNVLIRRKELLGSSSCYCSSICLTNTLFLDITGTGYFGNKYRFVLHVRYIKIINTAVYGI